MIEMVAVARSDHPLFSIQRRLSRSDLTEHRLVTIEGGSPGSLKQQPRFAAQRVFPVGSIDAAIAAVRSGLCFGWLPKYRIQSEFEQGVLSMLPLAYGKTRSVALDLVCRDLSAINVEANALAALLVGSGEPDAI
jgi:DNA-binding transcriptional LysR family regulator